MDSIKSQKLQTMKSYRKAQFLYNLIVYSLTAILSSVFYLYLFWFPSMRHFLFDFLPNIYSFFSSPKILFVLGNIIVIILVGESKLGSSRSSPATEIYDEYVERSRSLRRQSVFVCKKEDGRLEMDKNEKSRMRRHSSLNNIRSLEVKKKELAGRSLRRPLSVVEHKNEGRLKMHENEKIALATRDNDFCNIRSLHEEKNEEVAGQSLKRPQSLARLDHMQCENHEKTTMATRDNDFCNIRSLHEEKKEEVAGQILKRPQSLARPDHMQCENHEKTTMATRDNEFCNIKSLHEEKKEEVAGQSLKRPQSLARLDMHENEKTSDDDDLNYKMSLEEKRREMEESKDELNRRVEAFIARVNKQRMLEAREFDSSQD